MLYRNVAWSLMLYDAFDFDLLVEFCVHLPVILPFISSKHAHFYLAL